MREEKSIQSFAVFDGGDLYQIPARLRLTLRTAGDVKRTNWKIELYGVDRVLKACVDDMKASVAKATSLPVFMGSPE